MSISPHALLLSALLPTPALAQNAPQPIISIPLKPDPPFAIDGDLADWTNVPVASVLSGAPHVTIGKNNWKSPADLSATIHLAWPNEFLFVAAQVSDDVLRQSQRGANLWKGDHIELYLDTAPDAEPQRTALGAGQFHFGFSPGNFQNTGDALADLPPEATVFSPANGTANGVLVAAKRSENGYTLEAAIPWTMLGLKAGVATPLKIEAGVSDTDGIEPKQEKMMTLGVAPWKRERTRLLDAVLSPASGVAPPVVKSLEIAPISRVAPVSKKEIAFDAPAIAPGREAVLVLDARLDTPKIGGYTSALRLVLNGKPLDGARLLNKKATEERVDGKVFNAAAGDRFTVPYGPDFEAPDKSPAYALKNAKLARLELRVTDLLRAGNNSLSLEHAANAKVTASLALSPIRLEFRAPIVVVAKRAAPGGAIPEIFPATRRVDFSVQQRPTNALEIRVGGETFRVESEFSTPDGKWNTGANRFFSWRREIEKRAEAIVVRDTFFNLTRENLPLMQRHRARFAPERVWLAGISPASKIGASSEAANPTSFGASEKNGLGLMALDDVSQVHVANWSDGQSFGLGDNTLVLRPNATQVSEWAILPTEKPDYYAFVNAARRLREVNFRIDGGFAFLPITPDYQAWSDARISDFARFKNARFVAVPLSAPRYQGHYAHGTAFQKVDLSPWKTEIARRRKLWPDVAQLPYFHSFLDGSEEGETRFAADRLLRADGKQGDYGQPFYKLYLPTLSNAYGKAVAKNVDIALDELGFDGIYWDEMEYSAYAYHYGEPWDGFSADIDPKTFQITRLKSSVALLSQEWRLALAKRILARGPLVGNGAPHTRSLMNLHFPRFIESGAISNLARGQLYTPLALGDHLTEKTELDAYQTMLRALDYGSLYYWYSANVVPTRESLSSFMFPITPLELGEGFIIGQERIITKRSGFYGWNDASKHEIHLFDETGRETRDFKAPVVARTLAREGKTMTELRLPEDWSAAILKVDKAT